MPCSEMRIFIKKKEILISSKILSATPLKITKRFSLGFKANSKIYSKERVKNDQILFSQPSNRKGCDAWDGGSQAVCQGPLEPNTA